MIDIQLLRDDPDAATRRLQDRIPDAHKCIMHILKLDEAWRKTKKDLDDLNRERKSITGASDQAKKLKNKAKELEKKQTLAKQTLTSEMRSLPNLTQEQTPKGTSEKNNVTLKNVGKPTQKKLDYMHIPESQTWANTKAGAVASGARFSYITGVGAQLEYALLKMGIAEAQQHGFELVFPPTLIRKEMMEAMGYLDQAGEQEVFAIANSVSKDELVLIGTAEQALGAMCANHTFEEPELPKRYMAFTPCYRREAGSYGKDTKGILRQHQFEKLEMFSFVSPKQSAKEHALMLSVQETLMNKLELPYQIVDLAAGDLGYPSSRTFDVETWMPGQGRYRETHSTSNCTDYQSRRLNTRMKTDGKSMYVHTVNGTVFAMQRIIIALLENYQNDEGKFLLTNLPKALQEYL